MTFEECWMLFVGAVITTFVGAIGGYIRDIHKRHEEERKEHEQTIRELVRFVEEITEWRAMVDDRTENTVSHIKENNHRISNLNNGVIALMRNSILRSCSIVKERGHISIVDRDNITAMYNWYREAGGNGSCKAFYDEVIGLPNTEHMKFKNLKE